MTGVLLLSVPHVVSANWPCLLIRTLYFGNMPSMRPTFGRQSTTDASSSDQAQHQVVMQSVVIDDKGAAPAVAPAVGATGDAWDEGLDKDAQLGVKKAQATTLSWTTKALYTTLGWYVTFLQDARVIHLSPSEIEDLYRTS